MPPKKPTPPRLPLEWLPKVATHHKGVWLIAEHAHVLRILEDHAYELATCTTDDQKHQVCTRCRRQILMALVRVVGMDGAAHGLVMAITEYPMMGASLFLVGAVLAYLASKGGGH